jgi:hypothetical protein
VLDGADLFVARRIRLNVKRNSVVSVFLQVPEYFTTSIGQKPSSISRSSCQGYNNTSRDS